MGEAGAHLVAEQFVECGIVGAEDGQVISAKSVVEVYVFDKLRLRSVDGGVKFWVGDVQFIGTDADGVGVCELLVIGYS
jgi:hypothetical protein